MGQLKGQTLSLHLDFVMVELFVMEMTFAGGSVYHLVQDGPKGVVSNANCKLVGVNMESFGLLV